MGPREAAAAYHCGNCPAPPSLARNARSAAPVGIRQPDRDHHLDAARPAERLKVLTADTRRCPRWLGRSVLLPNERSDRPPISGPHRRFARALALGWAWQLSNMRRLILTRPF